ncbi:hypothetical protein [Mucilaginibacter boryungensis]|uniref:HEAT repeat protein n=1 Tax=Mucilaginibacter boryungensis TaxID=768480 RepID=A0ABR9XCN9_9SPHI|nr:hypothetical protein [Mucilaginibacter boryungensis]MBE9664950.1 hypothetical protein [Mucilaginibacter boryungensis]
MKKIINFLNDLFANKAKPVAEKRIVLIVDFQKLSIDERISQIIFCGDSADVHYLPLLKYAIVSDPEKDVKMAALKRIHLFASHPDTSPFIKELAQHMKVSTVEPYYSMALSKLNIISVKEFKERASKWI